MYTPPTPSASAVCIELNVLGCFALLALPPVHELRHDNDTTMTVFNEAGLPCDSQLKCVPTGLNNLHRLHVCQLSRLRVSNGADDVTGLELRRRHTSASYLHTCGVMEITEMLKTP